MRNLNLPILLLLIAMFFAPVRGQTINITKTTKWQSAPGIEFVERLVHFQSAQDFGNEVTTCPKISIYTTFRSVATKAIKRINFELVLPGLGTQIQGDTRGRASRIEKFNYDEAIVPRETGGKLFELADCCLTLPVRQTVRVVRVVYEDGSIWSRNSGKAEK